MAGCLAAVKSIFLRAAGRELRVNRSRESRTVGTMTTRNGCAEWPGVRTVCQLPVISRALSMRKKGVWRLRNRWGWRSYRKSVSPCPPPRGGGAWLKPQNDTFSKSRTCRTVVQCYNKFISFHVSILRPRAWQNVGSIIIVKNDYVMVMW